MDTYFTEKSLLEAPVERAAFSDRQAYVCAELSRLAYYKFEGGNSIQEILEFARPLFNDDDRFKIFEAALLARFGDDHLDHASALISFKQILNAAGFEQVYAFSKGGTQGFLCTRTFTLPGKGRKTVAYLAFRGTEPRSLRDIRTDVRATLREDTVDGVKMAFHTGYYDEVAGVADDIDAYVKRTSHQQFIATGHSLGGALAIVYTRLHAASVNGACYTFGAPPVGTVEVQEGLRTPIYEIANELDIVPNLPNPWLGAGAGVLLRLLRMLLRAFTVTAGFLASVNWDERLEEFVAMMTRYRHPGYRSYLVGSKKQARLRYNLSTFDSFNLWRRMILNSGLGFARFEKLVSDHMIDLYVEKIRTHATARNVRAIGSGGGTNAGQNTEADNVR